MLQASIDPQDPAALLACVACVGVGLFCFVGREDVPQEQEPEDELDRRGTEAGHDARLRSRVRSRRSKAGASDG